MSKLATAVNCTLLLLKRVLAVLIIFIINCEFVIVSVIHDLFLIACRHW